MSRWAGSLTQMLRTPFNCVQLCQQNTCSTNRLLTNARRGCFFKQRKYLSFFTKQLQVNGDVSKVVDGSLEPNILTDFGYQRIDKRDKEAKVNEVFKKCAQTYDLMNDLMSLGTHRLWKEYFVRKLNIQNNTKILDMAGGTGDIAFRMLDYTQSIGSVEITVSDINEAMMDVGMQRADKLAIKQELCWVKANAEELPFEDDSFDLFTIAFGIRNVTNINQVLDEAYRVLKPGGRFSCLEFSNVDNSIIKSLYDGYSFQVIPVMGDVIAADWDSYQYLVESIRKFPNQETFADLIYDAGFSNITYENLTFGVVAIHDGFKL